MSNWILKGVKKPYPMSSVPHGVFVGWGGGGGEVLTMGTNTLGLKTKTNGQKHFCKARNKAWYFRVERVGLSPISLSIVTLTLQLSFTSRARSWPWQNTGFFCSLPGHFLERSEKASTLKLKFSVNLRGQFLKAPSLILTKNVYFSF